MIGSVDIGRFDKLIDIQSVTEDTSGGQLTVTWANTYQDVRASELRASGNESYEEFQQIGKSKKAFIVRKFGRTFNRKMRVVFESENYYITETHSFRGDRRHVVLECESRDND